MVSLKKQTKEQDKHDMLICRFVSSYRANQQQQACILINQEGAKKATGFYTSQHNKPEDIIYEKEIIADEHAYIIKATG